MRRACPPTAALAALAALAVLLGACRPLYLPPIPSGTAPPPALALQAELAAAVGSEAGLMLTVFVERVPEEGWLAVQWFDPSNREVASDSAWLDGEREGLTLELPLPADVAVRPGEWRALLSFGGVIVRQLSVEVGE